MQYFNSWRIVYRGVQCVWAASGDYAGEGNAVTDESLTDYSGKKVIGGWDIYNGHTTDDGSVETNTSITISSGTFDDIIGGSHIKQPVKDYTDKNFTVNIGNTDINITGGDFTGAVIGGSKANNSDKTILNVGNINVDISNGTFAGIIVGGNNIKSTGNPGGGTPAENTATAGDVKVNISGGTFGNTVYGGSVADNYGTVQADGKPVLKATDNSTELTITGGTFNGNDLFAGGAAIGTGSEYDTENASVIVKDANVDANIYGGAYADKGTATVTQSNVQIDNSTVNGSVYAGGKAENKGTTSVGSSTVNINNSTINGNVIGDSNYVNNSNIKLEDTTVNGVVYLDTANQKLEAKDLKVNNGALYNTTTVWRGIDLNNGAYGEFTGKKLVVNVDTLSVKPEYGNFAVGMHVRNGSNAIFNADNTVIDVRSSGGNNKWGFGLLLENGNNSAVFNGGDVSISTYTDKYTAQTLTAKAGSTIDFNNTGDVTVKAESPYGVTAVDANSDITFNNTGNVDIIGAVVPGDKTAKTNVVGIQSGTKGTEINVTNNVKDFNITLSGAGVDNDETSFSTGTTAVILTSGATVDINSETFNIDMKVDSNVTPDAPTGHTTEKAYGLQPDGGVINVGENTYTSITIDEGLGTGYAIYSEGSTSEVNVLGNTDINVTGKTGAYALYAVDGGTITVGSEGKTVSLVGDVVADSFGQINIVADEINFGKDSEINTINSGDINISGKLNIIDNLYFNGGKYTTYDIANDITSGVLVLDKNGVLVTKADQVFTNGDATSTNSGEVKEIPAVSFKGGTVNLTDAEYTFDYVQSAVEAMDKYVYDDNNTSKTSIVMTGDLIGGLGDNQITVDNAGMLGDSVALDKVTIETSGNLLVGSETVSSDTTVDGIEVEDSVANGFNASSLDLKVEEGTTNAGVVITNGQNVTLGGSQGSNNLITVNGGAAESGVSVIVGVTETDNLSDVTDTAGSFTIGNALATSETEYTLTGNVTVNAGSQLITNGQTTITNGVTLNDGKIDAASGVLNANVNVEANTTNTITGTVNADTLTSDIVSNGDNKTVINIGNKDKAANVVVEEADLNGATVFIDPAWKDGVEIVGASNMAVADTMVDGAYVVGRNAMLSFGVNNTEKAHEVFAKTGLTWGEDGITAGLYIADSITLGTGNTAIMVDGSYTTTGAIKDKQYFHAGANSITMIDGSQFTTKQADTAIKDVGTYVSYGTTYNNLYIDSDAKLFIDNAKNGEVYQVLAGDSNNTIEITDEEVWSTDNIDFDNTLLVVDEEKTGVNNDNTFVVGAKYQNVDEAYGAGAVVIADIIDKTLEIGKEGDEAFDFFNAAASSKNNVTKDAQVAAFNSAANMGEMGGVNHAAYSVSNAMTDAVADHLSIATHGDQDKDIWAHYVHNKENIEGISLGGINADYDLQYNGIVVGSDLYKNGKATAGIALSYIEGDVTNSNIASNTKNEAEYYGASVYGRIDNGNSAVLGDITYMHGSSDITQQNSGYKLTADADTDVFSIGVRAEQKVEAGIGQFVPYAGLRYMHIGTGNYTNSIGMSYDVDEQNLWLLPVGVTYSCEAQKGDWTIRPVVEAGYVWAMGDRDTNQTVSLNGAADGFGFDTTDSGSFVSRFAVEAEKANVVYSLGYEYQKGDTVKANKWMANITFTF
mgnify:CR=1 FL=1